MKGLLLTLMLMISSATLFSQSQEESSIYSRAIIDLIEYRKAKGISSTIYLDIGSKIRIDFKKEDLDTLKVVLITFENKKSIYKSHNNELTHWQIFPANVKNDKLVITFIPYHGSRKGRQYLLEVSDGYDLIYKFDISKNQFEFLKVKEWGI